MVYIIYYGIHRISWYTSYIMVFIICHGTLMVITERYKKSIIKYSCFTLGMAVLAFGLFNIHSRTLVSEGGVLGATLLLRHWFGISPSITSFVLDAICFALGTRVLGWGFLRDSIIASGLFSTWYAVFERMGPMLPDLSACPLWAAVLGALFVGTGTGLIVIFGGACGGDDALVLTFKKLWGIPVSATYFISDLTILLLSLSYIPAARIFYSLISVILSSAVIEGICYIERRIQEEKNDIYR